MLFKSKLSHFFMSLSLWTDETRLHEANLFVPGLPQQYNGSKLDDILQVIFLLTATNLLPTSGVNYEEFILKCCPIVCSIMIIQYSYLELYLLYLNLTFYRVERFRGMTW